MNPARIVDIAGRVLPRVITIETITLGFCAALWMFR
jgi:hypothetical protein